MPRTLEFGGSSNVKQATLEDDGKLTVTFANNTQVMYGNVTPAVMDEWEKAESAGRFFHAKIRSKSNDFPELAGTKSTPPLPKASPPEAKPELKPEASPAPEPSQDPAIIAANASIRAEQDALTPTALALARADRDRAVARAEKAEAEVAQLKLAISNAKKATAAGPGKSTGFFHDRPWRR